MIPIKIGKDHTGQDMVLSFNTHVLIAGQSGSGKSVMLNTLITQIYSSDPTAQFYMFDLKYVELIRYRFLCPIRCELKTTLDKLRQITAMMMKRYVECIDQNEVEYKKNPVYVVIDEYADITSRSLPEDKALGKQIQAEVEKIARMGRAANVHLIICTQYPVATVVSMTIKQQCGIKLCMKCNSDVGYRVVLGHKPEIKPSKGRGQCLIQYEDESEELFQGTYTSNEYVLDFVKRYSERLPQWIKDELARDNKVNFR